MIRSLLPHLRGETAGVPQDILFWKNGDQGAVRQGDWKLVDAAAKAAELAVTRGQRGLYNVTETDGTTSSEKAIRAFGWDAGWRCGR